jgi:predicted alpha/beta-fold hydrolase
MRGHFWTVLPHLVDRVRPPSAEGRPWSTQLPDDRFGSVRLSGYLDEVPDARAIVIIVHGMGSSAEVSYVVRAAKVARAQGFSVLRLNLRGAQSSGEDIYYAGLVGDLQAAIESPEVRRYQDVHVIGFSLGGHMVMRYALDPDPQVRSVASICAPVDLQASCRHIDARRRTVYRRHLLTGLRESAQAVESRRGVRLSKKHLESIRSIREWDNQVVAPRFGYRDADDYYNQVSVGPHLGQLALPSLLVFAEQDPMVAARDIRPSLRTLPAYTEVRWLRGGHVYFPDSRRVLDEVVRWLRRMR